MDNKQKLIAVIQQFEAGKLDLIATQSAIKELCGKDVARYELDHYWRSASIEEYCNCLSTPPIENWQGIDDAQAILIIREMLDNIANDAILERNVEALEKRYAKPSGTLVGLLFHKGIDQEQELLARLKQDTTIYL